MNNQVTITEPTVEMCDMPSNSFGVVIEGQLGSEPIGGHLVYMTDYPIDLTSGFIWAVGCEIKVKLLPPGTKIELIVRG